MFDFLNGINAMHNSPWGTFTVFATITDANGDEVRVLVEE
jgi:hypothetical protein